MILGSNSEKMSKSRGNVINPDEIIKTHGADALRLYEMFMGPLGASLPWAEEGLNGVRKWLDRVYRLFETKINDLDNKTNATLDYAYNLFIRNVSHNIEKGNLNVAISDMMVFINSCYSLEKLNKEYLHNFLIVLSCFAPHLAEELNSMLGYKDSIYNSV
jgi:leucyl-tRNA synthetase